MVKLITLLIIFAVVIITGVVIFYAIKNKVRHFSREIFGTEDIIKGLKDIEAEANNTPLSLSGGDAIYHPKIMYDFKDYHRDIMEKKVKDFIFQYLSGTNSKEMDTTETLKRNLDNDYAANLRGIGYNNIVVHDAAISGYEKSSELATVYYQVAVEYVKSNRKVQSKYSVSLVYLFKDTEFGTVSVRCNFCNAPLGSDSVTCTYCGAQVVRNIEKVWKINDYKKLI
jgi:hypothetical protein